MKAHISGAADQLQSAKTRLDATVQKYITNAFIQGAKSISQIAIREYMPAIKRATTYDELRAAVDQLSIFLGKGINLK